jgi:hypothetical protein
MTRSPEMDLAPQGNARSVPDRSAPWGPSVSDRVRLEDIRARTGFTPEATGYTTLATR